jgi:transglutaminase-like putative cysteine protease
MAGEPAAGHLDPEEFQFTKWKRNYSDMREVRGGGAGGSKDNADSVDTKRAGAAGVLTGWEMIAGFGRTKIMAAVRAWVLSWQQDIEQLVKPLPL